MRVFKAVALIAVLVGVHGNSAIGDPIEPGDPIEFAPTTVAAGAMAGVVHSENGGDKWLTIYACPTQPYPLYTCECLDDGIKYIAPLLRDNVLVCKSTMPATGYGINNRLNNCTLRTVVSQAELCMVADNWYAWSARVFWDCPGHSATNIQIINTSVEDHPEPGCCSSTQSYSCPL